MAAMAPGRAALPAAYHMPRGRAYRVRSTTVLLLLLLLQLAAAPWQIDPACVQFPAGQREWRIQLTCNTNETASTLGYETVEPHCNLHQHAGPAPWLHIFTRRNVVVMVSPKSGSTSIKSAVDESCVLPPLVAANETCLANERGLPCRDPMPCRRDCREALQGFRATRFNINSALRVLILRDPWQRALSMRAHILAYNKSEQVLIRVPGCEPPVCSLITFTSQLRALCARGASQAHHDYWTSCENEHLKAQALLAGPPEKTRYHFVALLSNATEMRMVWSNLLGLEERSENKHRPNSSNRINNASDPGRNCNNAPLFCRLPASARHRLDPDECCRALRMIQTLYAADWTLARGYGMLLESDPVHFDWNGDRV